MLWMILALTRRFPALRIDALQKESGSYNDGRSIEEISIFSEDIVLGSGQGDSVLLLPQKKGNEIRLAAGKEQL